MREKDSGRVIKRECEREKESGRVIKRESVRERKRVGE